MKKGRIYTVHYGENTKVTEDFIKSIHPFLNSSVDLVIINNSNNVEIENSYPNLITIINSETNRGYFGGIKHGIESISINDLDYIVVCNNDVQIENSDFFQILESKLNKYDIIAPSIKTSNGIEQNPHREKPVTIFRKFYYSIYFSNYLLASILNKVIVFKKNKSRPNLSTIQSEKKIFSPHGAFIILNTSFFKKGGVIDDGYFLYGEEDSLAAIAEMNNMTVGLVPSLKIKHYESISIGKRLSLTKYNYQKKAYKYIKSKYSLTF